MARSLVFYIPCVKLLLAAVFTLILLPVLSELSAFLLDGVVGNIVASVLISVWFTVAVCFIWCGVNVREVLKCVFGE